VPHCSATKLRCSSCGMPPADDVPCQEHALLAYLDQKAYLLMAIDEERALELLAAHLDTLAPGEGILLLAIAGGLSAAEQGANHCQVAKGVCRKLLFLCRPVPQNVECV